MMYLILCKERTHGVAMWWRPNSRGYTTDTELAGRYSKEEALGIAGIRGEDFPVPETAIGTILVTRTIVDVEDAANFVNLQQFADSTEQKDCVK